MKFRVGSNPDRFVEAAGLPTLGTGVIIGENVCLGKNVTIWNYVVIQENCVIGDNVMISSFCDIGKNVSIGNNTQIQAHCTISNECKIGNRVFIGPNTSLLNDTYPHSNKLRPVEICDDVVISGGVVIMPDVIINDRAVVAGAAVVTKDVDVDIVVKSSGLPARPFMDRSEFDSKKRRYEAGPNRPHKVKAKV